MPTATALDHALTRHFAPLVDPRNPTQRRHILLEMIVIAIAAILGGAEGFVAIAQFGRSKEAWLRGLKGAIRLELFPRKVLSKHTGFLRALRPISEAKGTKVTF